MKFQKIVIILTQIQSTFSFQNIRRNIFYYFHVNKKASSRLVTPKLPVNILRYISFENSLRLPKSNSNSSDSELVSILPPKGSLKSDRICIRVLSHKKLDGMVREEIDLNTF
jgi:hypothetical protein